MKELLRRIIRVVMTALLRLRSRNYVLPVEGRCVVIAPHQDDETLGCAGLIHCYRKSDRPVSIIYITDGSGSHPGHPELSPSAVAQLRRTEAISAMSLLGVPADALHFLNVTDGTLANLSPVITEATVAHLAGVLGLLKPTELFLPCRDDGSSEHTGAFNLTKLALKRTGLETQLFEYPVWARWSPLRLFAPWRASRQIWRVAFPEARQRKRMAIAAYASQTEPTPPWPQPVLPKGFAECFATYEEYFFER
jgi:N-acetylglucosamine malate deacetylase 1